MKKGTILTCAFLLLFLAGCGSKQINALDYVELGQYKGLAVTRMATTISDEDLQAQVDRIMKARSTAWPLTAERQKGLIWRSDPERLSRDLKTASSVPKSEKPWTSM